LNFNQYKLLSFSISLFFYIAFRHFKMSQPGSHGLAHHERGWKWVNPTRLTIWWARNFLTQLNPLWV